MRAKASRPEFDLVAVDAEGKAGRPPLGRRTRSSAVTYSYQWYQSDGKWRWQSIQAERLVAADTLAFKADAPTHLAKQLNWGPHRLTINDRDAQPPRPASPSMSGGGAAVQGGDDAPDSLRVASDKKNYGAR